MIEIKDKAVCSGCTACRAICPVHCIQMQMDEEGFYYPQADSSRCVSCGLCAQVCPYRTEDVSRSEVLWVYGCQHPQDAVRMRSTSGGGFSLLAEEILSGSGVVFGAGYDAHMHVVHRAAETIDALDGLRRSKYVQSDMGDTFQTVRQLLQEGRTVLFCGTPCQVEGLQMYLRKAQDRMTAVPATAAGFEAAGSAETQAAAPDAAASATVGTKDSQAAADNGTIRDAGASAAGCRTMTPAGQLYTADIRCYGVPSPGLFDRYMAYLKEYYHEELTDFCFRDKKYGYYGVNQKAVLADGRVMEDQLVLKTYQKTMFSKVGLRRSCYTCVFENRAKLSDFTLGDIWSIADYDPSMDDDIGTTYLEIHTRRGRKLFAQAVRVRKARYVKIQHLEGDALRQMRGGQQRHYPLDEARRAAFFGDMNRMPYPQLMRKHFPDTVKNRIDNVMKPVIHRIPGGKRIFRYKKTGKL